MALSGQFRVMLPSTSADAKAGLREVTISEEVFRRVARLVLQKEADTLYANGATFLSTGPGGIILDTLINKRHSNIVAGRFPDGMYAADLEDCLKEIANPGYYKKLRNLKGPTGPGDVAPIGVLNDTINKLETEIEDLRETNKALLEMVEELAAKSGTPTKEDVEKTLVTMATTIEELLKTADPEEVEGLQAQLDQINQLIGNEIKKEVNEIINEIINEEVKPNDPDEAIAFPEAEIGDEFTDEVTGDIYIYAESPVEGEAGIWVPKSSEAPPNAEAAEEDAGTEKTPKKKK